MTKTNETKQPTGESESTQPLAKSVSNMRLYVQVQDTPKEAQKQFNNGRFSGTDINPMWRIKKLTELFGPAGIGWWTEDEVFVTEKCEETSETAVFCSLKLFYKDPETGEISHGITGVGGNKFTIQSRNGNYCNDEAYKMAYTDALSIACKALGFSSDIYFANDKTKYSMTSLTDTFGTAAVSEDVAALIREIDALVRDQTKNMTSAQKRVYANEKIIPVLGIIDYKSCRDEVKMKALRDSLKAA